MGYVVDLNGNIVNDTKASNKNYKTKYEYLIDILIEMYDNREIYFYSENEFDGINDMLFIEYGKVKLEKDKKIPLDEAKDIIIQFKKRWEYMDN